MLDEIMREAEHSVPKRTEGRKSFLHTVFTTAMEGGIGYWSFADEYSWSKAGAGAVVGTRTDIDDIDDFYAIISVTEDDWGVQEAYVSETGVVQPITETQALRIDLKVIERGTNLLVDKVIAAAKSEDAGAEFSRKYLREFVVAWLTDNSCGDYDADVADIVVKLGLFGETVYG